MVWIEPPFLPNAITARPISVSLAACPDDLPSSPQHPVASGPLGPFHCMGHGQGGRSLVIVFRSDIWKTPPKRGHHSKAEHLEISDCVQRPCWTAGCQPAVPADPDFARHHSAGRPVGSADPSDFAGSAGFVAPA